MRIFKEKQSEDLIQKLEASIEQFNYEKIKERFLDKIPFRTLDAIKDYTLIGGAGLALVGLPLAKTVMANQNEIYQAFTTIGGASLLGVAAIGFGIAKSLEYIKHKQYDNSKLAEHNVLENLQFLRKDPTVFNDIGPEYHSGIKNKKFDTEAIIEKARKFKPE